MQIQSAYLINMYHVEVKAVRSFLKPHSRTVNLCNRGKSCFLKQSEKRKLKTENTGKDELPLHLETCLLSCDSWMDGWVEVELEVDGCEQIAKKKKKHSF